MPEHINFYTPENSAFYSRLAYSDLDPASECIRLLRIKPPITPALIKTEEIKCDLLDNIPLDSIRGKYTTLSYCAGSPRDVEMVSVNDIPFNAFANLGHALRQARHFWMESGEKDELLLWADQICINQNNPLERTHQVAFMADIYAASQRVLISLSTEHGLEGGLGWLQGTVRVLERWRDDGIRVPSLICDSRSSHGVGLNAFLGTIISSSWWARAWIRQEFICSPDAQFMATFESIHWKSLDESIRIYFRDQLFSRHRNEGCSYQLKQKVEASNPCLACLFQDDWAILEQAVSCARRLLHAKRNRELESERVRDLRHNLLQTHFCKASDPRDLIYAFLGISDRCYGIYPDYSPHISFQEICTQLAHNIICYDMNLDILQWAYMARGPPHDPGWPSWVPDWRTQLPLLRTMTKRNGAHRATGFSFNEDAKGNQKRILEVRGVLHTMLRHDPAPDQGDAGNKVLSATSEIVLVEGRVKKDDEVWALHRARAFYILRRRGQYHQLVGGVLDWTPIPEHYASCYKADDMLGLIERKSAIHPGVETVRIC